MLFNGNDFENVDWNFYHQKLETWYMSMKKVLICMTIIYRWKGLEKCTSMVKSVEYNNNWYNFNQIKMDSDYKEEIYGDDDCENRNYCHL